MAVEEPRDAEDGPAEEVRIDGLAAGGDGVGRLADGRAVFVPFTAPGDRARVRITEAKRRFARAQIEALLEPSPLRVAPECGVFGRCGGCAWQHLEYPAQLRAKGEILRDALLRLGGLAEADVPDPVEVLPSPRPYRYRGRARVLARDGRVGYRQRRSHALCATSRCPILVPELDAALARLAATVPAEAEEWELVAGCDGAVRVVPLRSPLPEEPRLDLPVAGERMAVSPGVFVQSNALLLDALAAAAHEAAGRGALAVELFCGAGFFTLGLARRFERVVAVESEGRAVDDLRHNLVRAGLANVQVVGGRAERILGLHRGADAVLVDPPRTGLPDGSVEALAEAAPARLVYVSCEPATLARDARRLGDRGWRLRSLRALDLFPQTPHVEAVATFVAGDR